MHGELVHTETDSQGVVYKLFIEQEELDVRGNALASGDDAEDKQAEDDILARLNAGDTWAWAQTTCLASFNGVEGFDHLGACCYSNTADFVQPGGYWDDMKSQAKSDLLRNALAGAKVFLELATI